MPFITDISKVLKLILCVLLCTSLSNLANAKYTIKFKNDNSLQYLYKKNVIYIYIYRYFQPNEVVGKKIVFINRYKMFRFG